MSDRLLTTTGAPVIYGLRWRFDFSDGKPSKVGGWCNPGNTDALWAWRQDKSNLLRASIEGKNRITYEPKVFAECDGWDFVNFQWLAQASFGGKPSGKLQSKIAGLTLITRKMRVTAFVNGEIEVKMVDYDNSHIAGFGR